MNKLENRKHFLFKLRVLKHQITYLIIVIAAIFFIAGLINPRFLSIRNLITISSQLTVLGILTISLSLLMISGGLDISIGTMAGLIAMIFAKMVLGGNGVALSIVVVLIISTCLGAINGLIISKTKVMPLIISLGMMYVYYGISLFVSDGRPQALGDRFQFLGRATIGPIPYAVLIYLFITFLFYMIRKYTNYGRRLTAMGGNVHTAYLSGLNVDLHQISIYALNGFIVGIAGLVLVSRLGMIRADAGTGYELQALAAAIVGGILGGLAGIGLIVGIVVFATTSGSNGGNAPPGLPTTLLPTQFERDKEKMNAKLVNDALNILRYRGSQPRNETRLDIKEL